MSNTKYKAYTLENFRTLPQMQKISEEQKLSIEVVGHVFPLKSNNYVQRNSLTGTKSPATLFLF